MYFSKWLLKSKKPIDSYQLHKIIWELFPDKADELRSFLFRVESTDQSCQCSILLQSISQPVPLSEDLVQLKEPKKLNFDIKAGNKYKFMLCANPTKKIIDKDGKTTNQGKVRVPIIRDDQIVLWLEKQLEHIAKINSVELVGKKVVTFYKNKSGNKHIGKIQVITFLGIMTVEEPELLLDKIIKGIGPAKAFGCGLLTLARYD